VKLITPLKKLAGMSKTDHGQAPQGGQGGFVAYQGVPYIFQNHVNLCRDACTNMLLSYYGKQTASVVACKKHAGINKLKKNPRGPFKGTNASDSMDLLDAGGLHPYTLYVFPGDKFKRFHIEGVLVSYAPFIAAVRSSRVSTHAILVFGLEGDRLFYHDPWKGANMSMTLQQLNDIAVSVSVTTATAHPVDVATPRQFGMRVDDEI
jgi:hypothetical protein